MHHKNILLVSATTRLHDRMRELSHAVDVSIALANEETFPQAISSGHEFDLVILDGEGMSQDTLNAVDSFVAENGFIPMLFVQDPDKLAKLHMPMQGKNDFILSTAGAAELEVRCTLLLWPGEESAPADIVTVDNMTINLATYQVYIDEKPVDLTLMEYSLLSFLATHPSRAYSRETLLHRVWGFEYCGGTRTVDVHIRRVRSKVGPQVASHIVTIRGVGYLFRILEVTKGQSLCQPEAVSQGEAAFFRKQKGSCRRRGIARWRETPRARGVHSFMETKRQTPRRARARERDSPWTRTTTA